MEVAERLTARELTRLWQGVLGRLELELNPTTFAQWLKGTRAASFEHGELVVETRSTLACDFLDRRMRVVVERAVAQAFEGVTAVSFITAGQPHDAQAGPAADTEPQASKPRPPQAPPVLGLVNCEYTFEEYLRGRGNALAIEACMSMIKPSDLQADRVLIYGRPGLGKTHLLHALACEAQKLGKKVACVTAEDFTNRYMRCMRGEASLQEFQAAFRTVDMLILDDLQLLPKKEGVQNELMATIDAVLYAKGKLAMASERHPFELSLLERLESRIAEGIITEIKPFEPAERRAFVECAARRHRVALPAWAIDRIAGAGVASARLMLGFVKAAAGLEVVRDLTPQRLDESLSVVTIQGSCSEAGERDIVERIARHYKVALKDIEGRARSGAVRDARAVAALALVERGYSLQRVGDVLGKRDKSTIHELVARGRQLDESGEVRRQATG